MLVNEVDVLGVVHLPHKKAHRQPAFSAPDDFTFYAPCRVSPTYNTASTLTLLTKQRSVHAQGR